MKVIGKKILLEQDTKAMKTEGGIVLPGQCEGVLPMGTVVKVGPDCSTVERMMRVIINDVGGLTVEVQKKTYLLLDEDDVLVILEKGDE